MKQANRNKITFDALQPKLQKQKVKHAKKVIGVYTDGAMLADAVKLLRLNPGVCRGAFETLYDVSPCVAPTVFNRSSTNFPFLQAVLHDYKISKQSNN